MNLSEQAPSKQWAPLKHRGQTIAEVWFKPEGESCALTFRIPTTSFHLPGVGPQLTTETLLKAVGISGEEVESWRHGDEHSHADLSQPLSPPPEGEAHLTLHVRLKPPSEPGNPTQGSEPELPEATWQELVARWRAIEGLEATIDTIRLKMESLRGQMESASKQTLTGDEKTYCLNADVAAWNKAKNRVHYTLPKAKEFIHRATWALATPERKQLGEIFKDPARPASGLVAVDRVREQLESLLKQRQVLSAQGVTVQQECEGVSAEIQGALRTLQSNAAARAREKLGASRAKGKLR